VIIPLVSFGYFFGWSPAEDDQCGMISLVFSASSQAMKLETEPETADTFRWIHPGSDPQLWQQIESAFQDELAPDEAKRRQDERDVYRYKYLQKVGILNQQPKPG